MLRTTTGVLSRLSFNESKTTSSALALEFVRWRRKPRWLPVAKSKLYRVPERKEQNPEEKAELMRLHNNYKVQMRSLRQYLREEVLRLNATTTADHIVLTPEQEEAEFQRCLLENEAWNQTIAAERNERLQKERERQAVEIRERLEAARLRGEERLERAEEIVRREKELAKTFITRDNLEVAIEQALANPVDYNFSIDLQGNIYRGRKTLPGGKGAPAASGAQENELRQTIEASN
ncbi:probable 28S ribosomal protein S26, mitochondrial [Anastrepha ludens]|uniref:probable 28S ribosomal protein S26, mitochondrial n=1 Tax=Anastrepha ludens TaxID=28586 RepID=UPI0023AED321|nr:probable 28S ribosomal protein S26, mitochondrial [Anastrepha ludens]XP_053953435.1 probable 28S ribosomal protein S26, mitochondrial [Anastrepha ludens]XP_053953436.1 probable 28S ribosomal protein S26, mitochondrial [Anastrepha ludens]